MIHRKTISADLDYHRPKLFVAAAVILFFVFLVMPSISFDFNPEKVMDKLIEDMSVNIDLPPLPKQDENVIAATDARETGNELNKVDDISADMQEQLREVLEFKPVASKDAETLQEDEAIVPPEAAANMEEKPMRVLEELPQFPGGYAEFVKWLNAALKYPERARRAHTQGIVKVSFVVEVDGTVTNLKFLTETHTALDAEVSRVLLMMPKWKPATEKGKPCRSVVAIPFVFAI